MQLLPYAHLFCAAVYSGLTVFVLLKNTRARLNQVCAGFVLCFVFWSAGYTFIQSDDASLSTARAGLNFSAIGWCFFSSLFLWFSAIFSGREKILGSKLFYLLLFIPPLLFIYQQWAGAMLTDPVKTGYGWDFLWRHSLWSYFFWGYYGFLLGAALKLLWGFFRSADGEKKRIQAKIILISVSIAFVLGSITNVIFPVIGYYDVPPLADVTALVFHFCMIYAIVRYRFMSITLATAAENIISTMGETLILLDKQGRIMTVNPAVCALLGYAHNDLEGKPIDFIFPEAGLKSDFLGKLLSGKEFKDAGQAMVGKDKAPIPVIFSSSVLHDESGAIAGIVCLAMDIRERKKAEEALRLARLDLEKRVRERTAELQRLSEFLAEESQKLAVTLSSIGDGVIATDTWGSVILMNASAEKITGWSQDEALNQPLSKVFKLIDETTQEPFPDPIEDVIATHRTINLRDFTALIAKDGRQISIADSAAPIIDRDGRIMGAVLVFRDITEKRNMEKELLKTMKLESLGVLAGGIAHDFNNLLTGILTNLSLAKMQAGEASDVYRVLVDAEYASVRAKDLTHQLLTFAKGGAPVKKISSVQDIIKDTADFVLTGSKAKVEFSFEPDLWPVEVDVGQISQVVQNLLLNAVQAMPEGGTIKVSVNNEGITSQSRLPLAFGPYVKITVSDSGGGIAPEHIANIFDPYFTTKVKGTGLGLATAYSIIARHKGHIGVESVLGKGTVFYIYLPATIKKILLEKEQKPVLLKGLKARILVMDDEDIILHTVESAFRYTDCRVVCVSGGEAAVSKYKEAKLAGDSFDVVILDLIIPGGMGGKETVEALRRIDPDVKAIVSSGYSNDPVMAEFTQYGFKGVVPKPYSVEELLKIVGNILEKH